MVPQEELKGSIEKILFQSTDTGFVVFVLKTDTSSRDKTLHNARGYLPSIQAGQDVILKGKWVVHPKFGSQFEVADCVPIIPSSPLGLKKFLGSGLIKGIGPAYAEKLVNYFGEKIIEIIEQEPDRLQEIQGIGPKRIDQIVASWQSHRDISRIMIFLQDKGISSAYATKIYKKYKHEAIAIVQQNPYKLAEEIWGIGFKIADQIAQNIGIKADSTIRIKAGINFAISQEISQGHLYVELDDLREKTCNLLEINLQEKSALIKTAFHNLYEENKIKIVTFHEKHFITLAHAYATEKGIASCIKKLLDRASAISNFFNIDTIYKKIIDPLQIGIELNEDQQKAVLTILQNKITIITGGPGTGKTTIAKTLLTILDDHKISYKLAAPTGRAAKRMFEGTRKPAETIHRLLEFDVSIMKFKHNEQNTIETQFLIIDEASMIDVFLGYSILKATSPNTHLIFIGDINQLPSVGAGNFLKDLINSKEIACVQLKEIYRQAKDSLIVANAHKINNGEFPITYMPNSRKDFIFIKEDDPQKAITHIQKIIQSTLPAHKISIQNTITLVPMNKGIVGTQSLNIELQKILNPAATKYIQRMGYSFKIGDRVMQIRNNYTKFIFNGDIGTITNINDEDKQVAINFNDKEHLYEFDELDEIVLAYAISIHKSQGSEYDAAIIPIFTQHFALLQRNLLYTALTRAKKLCIFIGQPKAIAMAIKNNKSLERITFLKEFLTTDLECRI